MSKDKKRMGQVINWKNEIGALAGPFQPNDTKASWLDRAARRAGISARYISKLYYGHLTDPKFSIAQSVLSAADQARLQEAKQNVQNAAQVYRSHAAALERIDADFHREQINALVTAARILGERDSA